MVRNVSFLGALVNKLKINKVLVGVFSFASFVQHCFTALTICFAFARVRFFPINERHKFANKMRRSNYIKKYNEEKTSVFA